MYIWGWYAKILTIPYKGKWVVWKRPKTPLHNIKMVTNVNCKIVGSLLQCKEAAMRPSSRTMTWWRKAGYINTQSPEATIVVDAVHNYIGNAVSIQLCSKIEVEAAEKLM